MYENYVKIFEDHYITLELEKGEYILTNNQSQDRDKSKLKVDPDSGFELEPLPKKESSKKEDVQH
jgi:hypothetical protein